jgi:hypothetical protein
MNRWPLPPTPSEEPPPKLCVTRASGVTAEAHLANVLDAAISARADEHFLDGRALQRLVGLKPHVAERTLQLGLNLLPTYTVRKSSTLICLSWAVPAQGGGCGCPLWLFLWCSSNMEPQHVEKDEQGKGCWRGGETFESQALQRECAREEGTWVPCLMTRRSVTPARWARWRGPARTP